jgi:Uma2 family endonuclease
MQATLAANENEVEKCEPEVIRRVPDVSYIHNPFLPMWEPEPYVLDLSDVIRLSNDDLLRICLANPDLQIEQNAAGQLEIMPPAGPSSSARAVKLVVALELWNEEHKDGIVFDGTAGFRLPNGALRAADAAWLNRDAWQRLMPEQQEKFAHVVPDFLVEIHSPGDRLAHARGKMEEWMENGCRLAWLIDPVEREIHVYRPGHDVETVDFHTMLTGHDILPGFTFDPRRLP